MGRELARTERRKSKEEKFKYFINFCSFKKAVTAGKLNQQYEQNHYHGPQLHNISTDRSAKAQKTFNWYCYRTSMVPRYSAKISRGSCHGHTGSQQDRGAWCGQ